MASSSTAATARGWHRRNSKLESFLRRNLPTHTFWDIRSYEGCVIREGDQPPAFHYVVLTGEIIWITDAPPRLLRKLVAFQDVLRIDIENDFPDFLKPTLKDKCQHIRVQYRARKVTSTKLVSTLRVPSHKTTNRFNSTIEETSSFSSVSSDCSSPRPGDVTCEESTSRSISSVLSNLEQPRPRSQRSSSSMAVRPVTEHVIASRRSYTSLDRPRETHTRFSLIENYKENSSIETNEIHLYILESNSTLFYDLQHSWFYQLISRTLDYADLQQSKGWHGLSSKNGSLTASYHRFKQLMQDETNDLTTSFRLLQDLKHLLGKNNELKKIFWKDQILYHFLQQQLQVYMLDPKSCDETFSQCEDVLLMRRLDELEMCLLMVDIFVYVLKDSDSIEEKIEMFQFNNGAIVKSLLQILMSPPRVPSRFDILCSRMLEDHNEYSSMAWKNLPESELIKSLAEMSNSSTAAIYELVITIGKLGHQNSVLLLSNLLEGIIMEKHLKRSVTQILSLLFPASPVTLGPIHAVQVYQHLFVLRTLMLGLESVHSFIYEQYEEEFRYYINWRLIKNKIPEYYPVKILLFILIRNFHNSNSKTTL